MSPVDQFANKPGATLFGRKQHRAIFAIRMLCSTSVSHSTCARPSLCVGLHRAVRIASTRLEAIKRAARGEDALRSWLINA